MSSKVLINIYFEVVVDFDSIESTANYLDFSH